MSRGIAFCEKCREDVEYTISAIGMSGKLKEHVYEYEGERAVCNSCGGEVYVSEVFDNNLKALYDQYRKRNDIISLEEIIELPVKYDIGKRPLSQVLGWGETTFSRYHDGDMPSKQYSDILKRVYNEPEFFKAMLEANKGKLNSPKAYEKSMRKLEEILDQQTVIAPKLELITQYILHICQDITPLALQKVLYYIQGFYYAFEGEFIIDQNCEAWLHGPVYREVYDKYSSYRFDPIENTEDYDVSLLTTAEKSVIDSVIRNFCCYSGKVLEMFTHMEEPWLRTRDGLPAGSHSNRIIEKDLIGKYFEAIKEKYNMLTPGDIQSYVEDRFSQIT